MPSVIAPGSHLQYLLLKSISNFCGPSESSQRRDVRENSSTGGGSYHSAEEPGDQGLEH
jgi:hypothetical protein